MRFRPKEPFNCYSHLLGAVLGAVGLVALVLVAAGNARRVVVFSVYGASLVLLYSASTLHHWLEVSPAREDWLRRLDHVAIFVLIAGTYTPICLLTLGGGWGWSLFAVVWALAVIGAIVKLFLPELPRWVTAGLYLGMGWLAVVATVPIVEAFPLAALFWMVAGGLAYTTGAVIYGLRRPDPFPQIFGFHEIFHVMVLAGSTFHYVLVLRYVALAVPG